MKLRYRGNYCESHPETIETHETEITAKFRGLTYQVRSQPVKACSQPITELKYRGVAYTANQNTSGKSQIKRESICINPGFGFNQS